MAYVGRDSHDGLSALGGSFWNDVSVRLLLEEQFPCCLPTLHAFPVKYGKKKKLKTNKRFIYLFCLFISLIMCVLIDWSSVHAISFYQQIIFSDNCRILCVPGWLCDTGGVLMSKTK